MDDNILGKNIQHMRKSYGETQDELGSVLHVAKTTIQGYESGRRKPDAATIEIIASYYGKTIDEMMSSRLFELEEFNSLKIVDMDEMMSVFLHMLPLIETEEAYKNTSYSKGMLIIKSIISSLKNGEEVNGSIINEIMECFVEAAESDIIEAVANMIWCIFFLWSQQYTDLDKLRKIQSRMNSHQLDFKEFMYEVKKDAKKTVDKKDGFIEDFDKVLYELIGVLKENERWSQLGDYYLALRYILGLIDTGNSDEMNQAVGMQMMLAFVQVGNKYALDFLESGVNV